MPDSVYDVAVVGYGPAGITAAIYATRKRLSVVLFGDVPGGEITNSGEIENWPGDRQTDGLALSEKFVQHLKDHSEAVTMVPQKITAVTQPHKASPRGGQGSEFHLTTEVGQQYRAKTVIYAAGRHPRLLNVPGEAEFKNKGVSYCATCDAPLFPDKTVAVIGGGNSGAEAVIMLQRIAKHVYLLHIDEKLKADPVLVDNFKDDPKVTILTKAKTTRITGEKFVTELMYEDLNTGEEKNIAVQGIFVTIGSTPNTQPVKDFVKLDEYGAIVADRYGATDVSGFFAAGDVTNIRDAQIVVAAGQGCSAALSAGDYLSRLQRSS